MLQDPDPNTELSPPDLALIIDVKKFRNEFLTAGQNLRESGPKNEPVPHHCWKGAGVCGNALVKKGKAEWRKRKEERLEVKI